MLSEVATGTLDGAPAPLARPHAIEVSGVSKRYRRYGYRNLTLKGRVLDWLRGRRDDYREFEALKDVSFTIATGEMVALVGRNGAGKSTLLRIVAGVAEPDAGSAVTRGRVSPLLELGAGFSFELTGRRNIYLYGALLGLTRRQIDAQLAAIVEFSEVGEFLDTPVKHYSSGMYLRLAFAVAAHLDPDILLLDEVLTVGDAGFQEKCLQRMYEFQRAGKTMVLVTHDLGRVIQMCDRAILLDHGHLLEDGDPVRVVDVYRNLVAG